MPIYEYRCEDGHTFEVFQSMSDDPVRSCEVCGESVERVFHPVAVHFKGSGFYTTDYARGDAKASASEGKATDKKDSTASTDGKRADGKAKDSKKSTDRTKAGSG